MRSEMAQSLAWISAWTTVEMSLYLKPCELTMFEQHDSLITLKPRCRKSAVEEPFIFSWHVGGSIVQIGLTDLSEKLWCCLNIVTSIKAWPRNHVLLPSWFRLGTWKVIPIEEVKVKIFSFLAFFFIFYFFKEKTINVKCNFLLFPGFTFRADSHCCSE